MSGQLTPGRQEGERELLVVLRPELLQPHRPSARKGWPCSAHFLPSPGLGSRQSGPISSILETLDLEIPILGVKLGEDRASRWRAGETQRKKSLCFHCPFATICPGFQET